MADGASTSCVGMIGVGEMGAAVARTLTERGLRVVSVLDERSEASRRRAATVGVEAVPTAADMVGEADVVLSVVPPADAVDAARWVSRAGGGVPGAPPFVDANAVSPATAATIRALVERSGGAFVDGCIIGGPPRPDRPTRLYLSGDGAERIAAVLRSPALETAVLAGHATAASALKMCYAAWTKGTAALLLGIRALARAEEVEEALIAEWDRSQPTLRERSEATTAVAGRAWRFVGEMEEVGSTFAATGLPDGFALAARDVYRRLERFSAEPGTPCLDEVLVEVGRLETR